MSADYTIVIITHKRPRYLARSLQWHERFKCPVIVADNDDLEQSAVIPSGSHVSVVYRRGGLEVYIEKLQAAIASVTTPFVVMCDDDDFLIPDGVNRASNFLAGNPEFSFAQGYTFLFQVFGRRIALWPVPYRHDQLANAWIDRVENAVGQTAYYGVHRTAILRQALDFLACQDFGEIVRAHSALVDLGLTSTVARLGKMKRIPVPSNMREYGGASLSDGARSATIISRNVPDFYRNLLGFLMADDHSNLNRQRLLQRFSRHYAALLEYDQTVTRSKKRFVRVLPAWLQAHIEYWYRLAQSVPGYMTPFTISLLKIFGMPIYYQFRGFALLPGDRSSSLTNVGQTRRWDVA